ERRHRGAGDTVTKPPGRGAAGPRRGRRRGSDGRGRRGSARDAGRGPGAARASGRRAGDSPRPAGGRARTETGAGGASAKRKRRTGAEPRKTSPGSAAARGSAGGGPRGPRSGGPGRRPPGRRPGVRIPFRRRDPLKRLNVMLLAVAFVLSLFAGRLVQLQTIESGVYTEQAIRQRLQKITLPAIRGDITDAQGHPLAMTVEARAVYADPSLIEPARRQPIVNALAPTLGLDPAALMKKISKSGTRFVYLAHGVPPDQARLITSWDFPGIGTLPEYRREYPNDSL